MGRLHPSNTPLRLASHFPQCFLAVSLIKTWIGLLQSRIVDPATVQDKHEKSYFCLFCSSNATELKAASLRFLHVAPLRHNFSAYCALA